MEIYIALHETLRTFKPKLSASEVAYRANVSPAAISEFRHGERDLQVRTLQRIINVLPEDMKQHFFGRLLARPSPSAWSPGLEPTKLIELSSAASFSDIGQVLAAAGKSMMSAREGVSELL